LREILGSDRLPGRRVWSGGYVLADVPPSPPDDVSRFADVALSGQRVWFGVDPNLRRTVLDSHAAEVLQVLIDQARERPGQALPGGQIAALTPSRVRTHTIPAVVDRLRGLGLPVQQEARERGGFLLADLRASGSGSAPAPSGLGSAPAP